MKYIKPKVSNIPARLYIGQAKKLTELYIQKLQDTQQPYKPFDPKNVTDARLIPVYEYKYYKKQYEDISGITSYKQRQQFIENYKQQLIKEGIPQKLINVVIHAMRSSKVATETLPTLVPAFESWAHYRTEGIHEAVGTDELDDLLTFVKNLGYTKYKGMSLEELYEHFGIATRKQATYTGRNKQGE